MAARPILLFAMRSGTQIVAQCCQHSRAQGVMPGMTLAHARALIADDAAPAWIEPVDFHRDQQALHRLAVWALRFSPIVAPDPPDGLLIDITGCDRCFKGEERLIRLMHKSIHQFGFATTIAAAGTFGCAWGVARFGGWKWRQVPSGGEYEALRDLPIEALRIDEDIIEGLNEVAIDRVKHLFDLPRDELARRYPGSSRYPGSPNRASSSAPGSESRGTGDLLLAMDLAMGEAFEPIEPVRPVAPPQVTRCFDGPVLQIEAIELTVRELIDQLCAQLQQQESGVRKLEIELRRIDVPPVRNSFAFSLPSRNPKHIWSVLRTWVENANLGFGVEEVTLKAAATARLPHEQISSALSDGDAIDARGIRIATGELIDTLAARLGGDGVLRAQLAATHIPEQSFCMRSVVQARETGKIAELELPALERPTVLFDPPDVIDLFAHEIREGLHMRWNDVECRLIQAIGPERIAPAWWQNRQREGVGAGTRDYYRALDEHGRWLWIFRQRETERWFIHGVWS